MAVRTSATKPFAAMSFRVSVGCCLSLLAGMAWSEPVTPEMAKTAAASWLRDNPTAAQGVGLSGDEPRAEIADDGSVLWYEVPTDDGGCVITSSDTDVEPIVSYVEEWDGPLPADHPLRVLLVSDLSNRLDVVRREATAPRLMQATASAASATRPQTLTDVVSASRRRWTRLASGRRLLKAGKSSPDFIVSFIPDWREKRLTHWNQSSRTKTDGSRGFCYNYYTPSNYVCGCVATAGSSLLQFFNVTKGPDPSVAHECGVNRDYHVMLKPIGGDYDWSILPLSWANKPGVDDEQIELLGRVAYDMGVCCLMGYSSGGSGANERDLAVALTADYGFSSAKWVSRKSAEFDMKKQIYAQNRAGAPVGLAISKDGTSSGHSVVAVGYAEDMDGTSYTHVFMGWAGSSDAWYALPDMMPSFNVVDGAVTRISRDRNNVALCGRVLSATGKSVGFAEVEFDSGHIFRTDPNGFWAGRVPEADELHLVVCCGVTNQVSFGDDSVDVNFTVPDEATAELRNPADVDLDEALAALGKSGGMVSEVRLGNDASVSGKTDLIATVVMADKTECVISNGVTWKVAGGDAAFIEGRTLVPTAEKASMIVVMGEVWLRGKLYAFFSRMQVLGGLTVTGLDDIAGKDYLDLYESPTASYSALVTLSDGTRREMPLVWTVRETRGANAAISTVGVLSFASYDFEGEEEIEITASCGGFAKSKTVHVMSPGGILQYGGYFDKNVIWPGTALTCFPTCVRHERHGVVEDPMDASDGDLSVIWTLYRLQDNQWHNVSDGVGEVVPLPEKMPFDHDQTHLSCSYRPRSGRYELDKQQKGSYNFALTNAAPERLVTVSFRTEDGSALKPMTCLPGRPFVSLPELPKKGFNAAWTNASGAVVTKSSLVPDEDVTLGCSFAANTYWIKFNRNGATSGAMSNQRLSYGTLAALRKSSYGRTYYVFRGWSLTEGGPVAYQDGETVLNLTDKNGATINLHAVWEQASLTESVLSAPDMVVDPTQLALQLTFADGTTCTAFESLTWQIAAGDAAEIDPDGVLTPVSGREGTVTVAAVATVDGREFRLEKSVRIVNLANVADLRIDGPTVWAPHTSKDKLALRLVGTLDGQEVEFAAKAWRVDWTGANGEAFADCYTLSSDGTIAPVKTGAAGAGTVSATVGARTLTLALKTFPMSRSLSFSCSPSSYALYPGATVDLNPVIKVTYADGTSRTFYSLEDDEIGIRRLDFQKNSAGETNPFPTNPKPSLSEGTRITVPADVVYANESGKLKVSIGVGLAGSNSYTIYYLTHEFDWLDQKPELVHVVFDANGGRFKDGETEGEMDFLPERPYGAFLSSPSRLGYSLVNWYTAAEGGTIITTSSNADAGVKRLYAHWKAGNAATLAVNFHANFGTDEVRVQTFTRDEIAAGRLEPNAFVRVGWTFDGWSTTAELSQKSVRHADGAPLADLSFTSTLDLYAVWIPQADGYVLVPGTDLMLPKAWLEERRLVTQAGDDPVQATLMTAANGRPAWECYVAGLDPLDPKDDLTVSLSLDGGQLKLDYDRKDGRVYVEEGRPSLTEGDWHAREDGDRFFRVSVSLPPQNR